MAGSFGDLSVKRDGRPRGLWIWRRASYTVSQGHATVLEGRFRSHQDALNAARLALSGERPRLSPWLVGALYLVFLAACLVVSRLPAASVGPVSMTAWPPLVPSFSVGGSSTIRWTAGPQVPAQLWVSHDGAKEQLFGSNGTGRTTAPWIGRGTVYDFTLYAGTSHTVVLAHQRVSLVNAGLPLFVLPALLVAVGLQLARRRLPTRAKTLEVASVAVMTLGILLAFAVTKPPILSAQGAPDPQEYADAARQLVAGNGYVTLIYGEAKPPRYPMGYSLALAPVLALDHRWPDGIYLASKLITAAYLVIAVGVAWRLGGSVAAILTALVVGTAPFALQLGQMVFSDPLAAALMLLNIPLLLWTTKRGDVVAGLLAGFGVMVRLSSVVTLLALVLVLPWRRKLLVAAGAVPLIGVQAFYQWQTFGNPLMTGYAYWLPKVRNFGLDYLTSQTIADHSGTLGDVFGGVLARDLCGCSGDIYEVLPRIVFYPLVLLGVYWIFAPPLFILPAFVALGSRLRCDLAARYSVLVVVLTVALYGVYFYKGARFLGGAEALLIVWASVQLARWVDARSDTSARMISQSPGPSSPAMKR